MSSMTRMFEQIDRRRDMNAGQRPTNRNSDTYAQDTNAWLHRQQWQDYKDRFQPVEEQLIDETMGTELLNKRLSAITANADDAFGAAEVDARVTRGRYGIQQNAQEQGAQNRSLALGESLAVADARNNTRTAIYDRNMDTIAGGSSVANSAIR